MIFSFAFSPPSGIYTLSLHDALPIFGRLGDRNGSVRARIRGQQSGLSGLRVRDRKSTRLNSSHVKISYAVFCLKKKTEPTVTLSKKITTEELKRAMKKAANVIFGCIE